jgi:hypothetical protein
MNTNVAVFNLASYAIYTGGMFFSNRQLSSYHHDSLEIKVRRDKHTPSGRSREAWYLLRPMSSSDVQNDHMSWLGPYGPAHVELRFWEELGVSDVGLLMECVSHMKEIGQ